MEGKIVSLVKDGMWYKIMLENVETPFVLHHNWVAVNGKLKIGDKLRFTVSNVLAHGFPNYKLFDNPVKVKKKVG